MAHTLALNCVTTCAVAATQGHKGTVEADNVVGLAATFQRQLYNMSKETRFCELLDFPIVRARQKTSLISKCHFMTFN